MATTTAAIKATSEAVSSHGYSHNHKYSLSQSAVNERARLSSATNYLFSYNGTEPTTAEGDPTGHKQQKYYVITQLRLSLWIRRKMCQAVKQKKKFPAWPFGLQTSRMKWDIHPRTWGLIVLTQMCQLQGSSRAQQRCFVRKSYCCLDGEERQDTNTQHHKTEAKGRRWCNRICTMMHFRN